MKVDLRIERLILDGVELTRRERAALGPAIERELKLRVDGGPMPSDARATGRVDRIGRDVAVAIHRSLPRRGAR